MRSYCLVLMLLVTGVFASANATDVFDIQVGSPIAEIPLSLAAGVGHKIELRNVDKGAKPILQIVGSTAKEMQGAFSMYSQDEIRLPATAYGPFTLIVRSRSDGVYRADVWVDGKPAVKGIIFSRGTAITLKDLRVGEEIIAVNPPNGLSSHSAYLVSADGSRILARADGPSSKITVTNRTDGIVLYGSTCGNAPGRLKVYRNDRSYDADQDGLGDRLEQAIGTCASRASIVTGVSCRALADARDTDSDGLWDAWELTGKTQCVGSTCQLVPLHTWGANPRHKDIFIEFDFRRLTLQDNQSGLSLRMMPAVSRKLAAIYGDQATTDPAARALHAQDVGNPDGIPGINLHMDTGVAPTSPADATIYGDWGGYTAVDAVPNGDGGYRAQTPKDAMDNHLSEFRKGLFHYVLGYTSGGGACDVAIACGFNMADDGNSSHEFGHTLYLHHNGPNGTHEPNCKPNYPSLMNYAYLDTGFRMFSDGRGSSLTLNNHALIESGALASEPATLNVLRSIFQYRVDEATGSVDWDRDGVFQPPNRPVRAYSNLQPGNSGGCEFTREGEVSVGVRSQRSPAVVRYNNLLWIYTVTLDQRLEYSYTSSPWDCQNIDDCPTPSFPYHVVRDIGPVDAVDAVAFFVGGRWITLIVGIRPDGSLFETWMHMSGWQVIWQSTTTIPGSPAVGEPSLAITSDGRRVVLAYKGADGIARYRTRTDTTWQPEQQIQMNGQPLRMSRNASPGIAFTRLPVGATSINENLVGAFSGTDGYLRLYTTGGFPQGWKPLPIPADGMPAAYGRPSMAWTGTSGGAAIGEPSRGVFTAGRFYIVYSEDRPPTPEGKNQNVARMAMSYVDSNNVFRIGLFSYFDNVWSFAFGIDLLQPGEVGLRAAETYALPTGEFNLVKFRPHADGISNLPYTNKNDWPVLAWGTCDVLVASQPDAMKTVCPPKPW